MTGVVFWALVALATVTGVAIAWTLGANSNSPPFAPAIAPTPSRRCGRPS